MLKSALNALCMLQSRVGMIKRLGSPDIYTPCRLTPSKYFKFLQGPEYTSIRTTEFIIPVDTLTGQFAQKISFDAIPDSGVFQITFSGNTTTDISSDATAVDIQNALRLLSGLQDALVTGSFLLGFTITFAGFSAAPALGTVSMTTLKVGEIAVNASWSNTSTVWTDLLRRGDRIIDGNRQVAIEEVIELNDLGALIMAFRVRGD